MTTPYYQLQTDQPHDSGLNPNCPPDEIVAEDNSITIQGYIRDSANMPITDGWVRVTADATLVDYGSNPNVVATRRSRKVLITDGYISLNLINSYDSKSTYFFEMGYDEVVSTGPTITREVVTDSWHASIPRSVNGTLNFSELVPTDLNNMNLDQSARRVATLITTDPTMRRSISSLRPTGPLQTNRAYQYGDIVYVPLTVSNGQSWVYIGSSPSLPPNTIAAPNWVQLA